MVPSDYLFVDLSTRVKHPSRGLVREPGNKFVSYEAQPVHHLGCSCLSLFHELVLLIPGYPIDEIDNR